MREGGRCKFNETIKSSLHSHFTSYPNLLCLLRVPTEEEPVRKRQCDWVRSHPTGKKDLPARPRHSALGGSVGRGDLGQSCSRNDVSLNDGLHTRLR